MAHMSAMQVGCGGPRGRRDCDKIVTEVDEDVNEVPAVEAKLFRVCAAFQEAVIPVSTLQIVADQELRVAGRFSLQIKLHQPHDIGYFILRWKRP